LLGSFSERERVKMKEKNDLFTWDMIPLEIKANYPNNKDRIKIINEAEYMYFLEKF
jgi:hypothetical protein